MIAGNTCRQLHNTLRLMALLPIQDFDAFFGVESEDGVNSKTDASLKPAVEVYRQIKGLNFIYSEKEDADRFDILCKYILSR